jgi:peptide/bleomycin uptake transporter
MFTSFFGSKRWFAWSILGSILILFGTWYQVQVDVKINEWFGSFYDLIQKALSKPGSITLPEFFAQLITFAEIACVAIVVSVLLEFFIKHYIFRWRTAMNGYYMAHWDKLRHIEGASQRVQEDTMRFARLMEGLGVNLIKSLMTLAAFLPILWTLSAKITELPWIGKVDHSLIYVAILFALAGTLLLAVVGMRLPGLEYNNQRVEAAYRKELVLGEDDMSKASPPKVEELFANVRKNYFTLYRNYLYFDVAKWSYLQFGVLVPYIVLGPTVVMGVITFGVMQQIVRAFRQVEESFQYLVRSWDSIVETISVYKRLRAFELQINVAGPSVPMSTAVESTL